MPQRLQKGWYLKFPYLWGEEKRLGHDRPQKSRPCIIIGSLGTDENSHYLLAPITHLVQGSTRSLKLTHEDCRQLWLDDVDMSWLVVSEMNLVTREMVEKHIPQPKPGETGFIRRRISDATLTKAVLAFKDSVQSKHFELVDRQSLAKEMLDEALTWRRKRRMGM